MAKGKEMVHSQGVIKRSRENERTGKQGRKGKDRQQKAKSGKRETKKEMR